MEFEAGPLQQTSGAFLLGLPRVAGIFAFLPFLSGAQVPAMARNALIAGLGLIIAPSIFPQLEPGHLAGHSLIALAFKEGLLGALLGFVVAMVFHVPQVIGDFIDNQRGSSIASFFNPAVGEQSSNMGLFLSQAFLVWFIVAGGFTLLFEFIFASFALYPVTAFLPDFGPEAIGHVGEALGALLKLALLIAAPVIFAMLIAEVGLGLVSRFAPQLNVFFISMSLKSLVAVFLLLLYFAAIPDLIFRRGLSFEAAGAFLRALAPGG